MLFKDYKTMKEELEKKLDEYINKQGKNNKTKLEDCEQYKNLWYQYAKEEGFSFKTEDYLYKGLKYYCPEAFVKYLNEQYNCSEILQTLLRHQAKQDTQLCFKMNCYLLALLLNQKCKNELIAKIIVYLPKSAYNKEKKLLGNACKIFIDYFLEHIYDNLELQPLINYESSPLSFSEFEKFIKFIIPELKLQPDNLLYVKCDKLLKWVTPYLEDVRNKQVEKAKELIEAKKKAELEEKKLELEKQEKVKTIEEVSLDIEKISKELLETKNKLTDSNNLIEDLKIKNTKTYELLTEAENRASSLSTKLTNANIQIDKLNNQIKEIQDEKTKLQGEIINLKNEITDSHNMNEVITSVQTKRIDTTLNRISSQLKVEYEEFKEANSVEMSKELGEVLKEIIKSIFDKLSKAGIKME